MMKMNVMGMAKNFGMKAIDFAKTELGKKVCIGVGALAAAGITVGALSKKDEEPEACEACAVDAETEETSDEVTETEAETEEETTEE